MRALTRHKPKTWLINPMKTSETVQGHKAPGPRPTRAAAILLAVILALPVFGVLSLIEWALF